MYCKTAASFHFSDDSLTIFLEQAVRLVAADRKFAKGTVEDVNPLTKPTAKMVCIHDKIRDDENDLDLEFTASTGKLNSSSKIKSFSDFLWRMLEVLKEYLGYFITPLSDNVI